MDDYILIGLNKTPKMIGLSTKYLESANVDFINHAKIEYIDLLTSKYEKRSMKSALAKAQILDNDRIEMFVYHSHKFNGQIKLKYFPVLFKDDTTKEFKDIIDKKLQNERIIVEDAISLLSTFFGKYFKDVSFMEIADWYYTDLDQHTLQKYKIIFSKLADRDKRSFIKYEEIDYNEIRKLMVIINLYKTYGNLKKYIYHMNEVNVYNVKYNELLNKWTNKNYIDGQLELFLSDNDIMKIKNSSWDDPYMKQCIDDNSFSMNMVNRMTLDDQLRAGFITTSEYQSLKQPSFKQK